MVGCLQLSWLQSQGAQAQPTRGQTSFSPQSHSRAASALGFPQSFKTVSCAGTSGQTKRLYASWGWLLQRGQESVELLVSSVLLRYVRSRGDLFVLSFDNHLLVRDDRTNNTYHIALEPTGHSYAFPAKKLKDIKDSQGNSLRLYDPGCKYTLQGKSEICYIDGLEGKLEYRGYPVQQLAGKSNFL